MRTRGVLFIGLAAPAIGIAVVAGCNGIFGIVSRSAGPTWCEQDAHATTTGYCADFDRGDSAATAASLSAVVNATVDFTSMVASSPPNSLEVHSSAIGADAGVLGGFLVSFGQPVTPGEMLPPFMCQLDVYSRDILALPADASVGILAVGGQALDCSRQPVLANFAVGPSQIVLSLQRDSDPNHPSVLIGQPYASPLGNGFFDSEWTTVTIRVAPEGFQDAAIMPGLGALGVDDAGHRDRAGCAAGEAGRTAGGYVVVVQLAAVYVMAARVPDLGFVGALASYGEVLRGPAGATTVHVDNVRCAAALP